MIILPQIERGRLSTATTPTWPHDGQLIRTIISVRSGTGERASSLEQGRKSPRQSSLRGLSLRRRCGEKGPPAARRSQHADGMAATAKGRPKLPPIQLMSAAGRRGRFNQATSVANDP
jgi:hypothetical protein